MKFKMKYYFLIFAAILIVFAGCAKKEENSQPINVEEKENEQSEEGMAVKKDENINDTADAIGKIDMSLKPNEIGEIMILMYHGIAKEEKAWERTPDNFRKDLEYMYKNGYRMISLNDYAKGIINTQAGFTPIVLTFDDGRQNNFNIIEKGDGKYEIDPDCAIGILEEFKKKYPDFNVTASFFLGTNIFGQEKYKEYKLKWLVENGYDVGNHTYSHNKMQTLDGEQVKSELGSVNNLIYKYIPDYTVETLALPHGSNPKDEYVPIMMEGEYEGKKYKNIAVLDVGWRPAYSPFDTCDDFTNLYRVTASETNVGGCGMYDYFKQFAENKREKFISDGTPDVVTIPKRHEQYINKAVVGSRILNIYE